MASERGRTDGFGLGYFFPSSRRSCTRVPWLSAAIPQAGSCWIIQPSLPPASGERDPHRQGSASRLERGTFQGAPGGGARRDSRGCVRLSGRSVSCRSQRCQGGRGSGAPADPGGARVWILAGFLCVPGMSWLLSVPRFLGRSAGRGRSRCSSRHIPAGSRESRVSPKPVTARASSCSFPCPSLVPGIFPWDSESSVPATCLELCQPHPAPPEAGRAGSDLGAKGSPAPAAPVLRLFQLDL